MKTKLLVTFLFVFSYQAHCQFVPPDPVPGCEEGIQRVGVDHQGGHSTLYWVHGFSTNEIVCEGVSVQVSGTMYSGDFAYAIVGMDQFTQSTPEEVDFSIDLTNVFESLPLGENVTVTELLNNGAGKTEMVLIKSVNPLSRFEKHGQGSVSDEIWIVKIKWYGSLLTMVTEDVFIFNKNETVYFNYLWDDSGLSAPIALISLGGNRISVSPYTDPNSSGLNNLDGSNPFEVTTFNLGIIESSVILFNGDQIGFDLNLIGQVTSS